MKISYITMQFPVPSEFFASLDINTLRAKGHDISIYAMAPKHKLHERLVKERHHEHIKISHFSISSFFNALLVVCLHPFMTVCLFAWIIKSCYHSFQHILWSIIFMLSTLYIFNQIRKDPPDIVHLFWGHYPTMIGYLVNRYMHNTVLTMFLGAYDLKKRYGGSIALGKHVDAVFTLSKSNIEQLRSLGISDNLYLVYGGIHIEDNSLFTPGKFKEIEKSVFITASRLIKEKCVDDILILFSAILKNNIGSKLLILGDGPERKYLETKAALLGISASTEFKGHIPHNEVLSHMSKSHFFVLMSKEDNLPNALKEAMYQQCVCIASETTGINELISNGKNGFVIEQHNVNTAAKIINDLLSDSKRCTAIAQNARQTIISNFNVNNTIQEYINIWEKALCAKLKNRKTGTYPC